ncbi:MAG: type II secretion system F family protein [Actinomycetota bacterium]
MSDFGLIGVIVIACGLAFGLIVLIRAARVQHVPLHVRVARLQDLEVVEGTSTEQNDSALEFLAVRAIETFRLGSADERDEKLRVLDKPLAKHATEKLLAALALGGISTLLVTALVLGGIGVDPLLSVVIVSVLIVAGWMYPDLPLDDAVAARQRAFRYALSSYLDLVTIILAGGGGIETALRGAAAAGDGWAFVEIRNALRRSDLTGRNPWELFEELGVTLGLTELRELAASIELAGGEGARVRTSLTAKSDSLRSAQAAELEQIAQRSSERMILPVSIMVLGLSMFVFYGAINAVSGGGTADFEAEIDTPIFVEEFEP